MGKNTNGGRNFETCECAIGFTRRWGEHEDMFLRDVRFAGEHLGSFGYRLDKDSGVIWELWRTPEGRLIVHEERWSHKDGEGARYSLIEARPEDFGIGGRFEWLGWETEITEPLTLDEALKLCAETNA
ncbi:MAG: hypothetical protein H5U01_01705 [Clostridia bacterium]|nr:hypothetical protein [Clostridia bacterium]